jgi:hypothetical protein
MPSSSRPALSPTGRTTWPPWRWATAGCASPCRPPSRGACAGCTPMWPGAFTGRVVQVPGKSGLLYARSEPVRPHLPAHMAAHGNGHRRLAAGHCDAPLLLDELKQAGNPRDVAQAAYMLTSGQGKGRGQAAGGLRETASFSPAVPVERGNRPHAVPRREPESGPMPARRCASASCQPMRGRLWLLGDPARPARWRPLHR